MRYLESRIHSCARFVEPLTLSFQRRGLVLVEGFNHDERAALNDNGSGKSMLFEASLAWAPFGKLLRYGDERIGEDEVCWTDERTGIVHAADVETLIETRDGIRNLRRARRRGGRPSFQITGWNGTAWEPLRGQDDESVARLLGFDYRTLRGAIFLHGEAMGASTYTDEIKIIESILRFDDYTEAAKIGKRRFDEAERTNRSAIDEMERLSLQVTNTRGTITELEALDESVRAEALASLIARCDELVTRVRAAEKVVSEARAIFDDAGRDYHVIANELATAKARSSALRSLSGHAQCPTCEQAVAVTADTIAAQERIATMQSERVSEAEHALGAARTAYYSAENELTALNAEIGHRATYEAEARQIAQRQERRAAMLSTQHTRLADLESRLGTLTEQVASARRTITVGTKWVRERGFEELKAMDFQRAMPILNDASQRYSEIISGGAIRVEFDPRRVSRDEPFIRVSGATAPTYKGMSSGEKRRADIIIALARRELVRAHMGGTVINVAVWDEVFDHLDERGVERTVEILQRDIADVESVFVVTHSPHVRRLFPGAAVIRVERSRGISRVTEVA